VITTAATPEQAVAHAQRAVADVEIETEPIATGS